jgi:tetratricopeptide (TPR) repeat protein
VVDRLGATARAWRATQIATCHADREVAQDAQVTACLDARLVELAGSVDDVIEHGAAGARYAVRIAGIPGSPAACASPAPGLLFAHVPADRELRRQVTALRDRIADAAERAGKGDLEQALHEVEQVAQASVIWAPMQAEAQYALGLNQRRSGDRKLGGTTLRAAAGTAERVHHDEVAANSWIVLSFATTFDDGDPPRGVEYITYAEAAADRIGRPAGVMVKLDYTKGVVLVQANRAREAEVALRAAFELAETVSPDDLSRTTQGLGVLYEDQGRYAEALDAYRKAIEHAPRDAAGQVIAPPIYFERVGANLALLGRPHEAEPEARHAAQLADRTLSETQIARPYTHVTLAQVLLDAGHPDEALREATAAAAIVAKTQGPRSERYGEALMIQGDILGYLGRYRQAEALLARACDIIAFTATDDDAESAACGVAHGSALVHVHRPNEALGKLDRATASLVRSHGEAHLWAAQALTARGSAHAAIGDHAQAIADFERAIAALAPRAIDPGYLATARGRLAQELWNDQPERARTEAATAERLFQTANARWATERAEQAAWRSHHTAGRR